MVSSWGHGVQSVDRSFFVTNNILSAVVGVVLLSGRYLYVIFLCL